MAARKNEQLSAYRAKRSADRTPEPFGGLPSTAGQSFVVQHHAARALHYDFRLELEGVLCSWAVPKGPSPNPADKRLAVHVEDHPLEYANFEGVIPEGNYGAGAVILWDRGTWVPLADPIEGIEKGKLLFELRGYKLRGKWTLVKTKRGPKDWLLIKERDGYVSEHGTDGYPADSILSGQTVSELKQGKDLAKAIRQKLKKADAPNNHILGKDIEVTLAQTGEPFSKAGWLFEIKYDGYRLIVDRENAMVKLYSRNGHDLSATFPEIVDVVKALPFNHVILDGEAVVHDEHGIPSFSRLQKRGRLTRKFDIQRATVEFPATLYAFDLLAFEDFDLRPLPLKTRKAILKDVLPTVGPVRYSDHIEEQGEAMYAQVHQLGLEGMVAKKVDSPYISGRSSQWLKIRIEHSDDFVIAGYTDPKGSQPGFGALLLGQYDGENLVYVGRVGTGFKNNDLRQIKGQLDTLSETPAPRNAPDEKAMHWLQPNLVCEVKFKEVTPDGVLRAPVFLRLREDKDATQCTWKWGHEELPEQTPEATITPDEKTVHFTNLDKVFWPEEGYTKGDLIDYYRSISPWLLPYLKERPVVLTRYPDGIDGKSFFQKDAPDYAPEWIRRERMWSEHAEREVRYFIVDDLESLLYIINMGTIPLHIWSSRLDSLERPDWCILDLDPKDAPFKHVVNIANAIRTLCEEIELPSLVKTSGSTGIHVLIPLGAQYTYEQSRTLGELLARVIITKLPDIATVVRSPARREGKVYIDYIQNGHGRLIVAPFSVRPLPGAPVSMPLKWKEVTSRLRNSRFTIKNAAKRMRTLKEDPLIDVMSQRADLNAALGLLSKKF
ncbi:MAG: DNA ligase D [Gammaproteobacteria bacterium]|nr:DNA ligase D [Gammaproteobacteria bacterium]